MKNNKEFDNILDECLKRLLIKGETIEQCLNSYPEYVVELKPLLETTVVTQKALAIEPRPEFKARARYQFQSALREPKPQRALPFFNWRPQWVMAIAITLAVLLSGGGTVAAAGNSMPDSPLYPVKLATEQVQLVITTSNINKAKLYAKLADKRVTEIVYIANKGKPEKIGTTVRRLNQYLTIIASLPLAEPVVQTAPSAEAPVMLAPHPEAATIEPPARAPAPGARQRAQVGKEEPPVKATAPSPPQHADTEITPVPQPTTAKGKLKKLLKRNSANHPEALRAVLERVPDSAKPALREAIKLSTSSYDRAINALD